MNKILVTPRSLTRNGDPALAVLKEAGYEVVFSTPGVQPNEDELVKLLPRCVGYLAGVEKISARVLEAAKDLLVLSRNGTGIDNIDLEAARRQNIRVCRAEGANARGVAELTIGLIFALVRSIPYGDAALKREQWERRQGIELQSRVLGLIGCGQVGKSVALLGTGIGMQVIAFELRPDPSFAPANFCYVSLDDLCRQSDIVSLHCLPLESGKPMIDKDTITKMKRGVYLVNTARASLMHGEAVLAGLNSGQLAGVAIDVFAKEPPADYRLVKHDRVIATPHSGGYTVESVHKATAQAVDNLLTALREIE
jgi:phosphoglycerate dehydrogenase-like enzyme